ncbi:mutator type transposase, partial [Tanacetum coccineum]
SIPINSGLIQAITTSLPPQPIGEATKASNLQRILPGVQGRSHFTYFLYLIIQIRILPFPTLAALVRAMDHRATLNSDLKLQNPKPCRYHVAQVIIISPTLNASLKNLETQIEQLIEELHSLKEKSEQAKVVIVEHEGPSSPKKVKNLHNISFLSNSQEENTNDQLPTKESNPRHFTLPYTIGNFNFYAMADLGASVNVQPRNIFEYLELTKLSETEMLVEMADMRKKAQLRIVRDILVKIDKFLFPSDFVILDQTPNSTVILGRTFLATFTEALDPDKNPLERCLDEYNWVFPKEIEQLSDEYEIKIGEKGQVLEEI